MVLQIFLGKAKGSFYGDLNQMPRLIYSYDQSQPFILKSNASICNSVMNPYDKLQAIELRTKINNSLAQKIHFFYLIGQQEIQFDEVINDNKSIFLKLNDILVSQQEIQVCILNNNTQDLVFNISKESGSFTSLNLLPTFRNKAFPIYLYYLNR